MFKSLTSQIKDIDQQGRVVVAANAFGNVDSDNDVSMAGSFTKTLKENFSRLRWFLNHDRNKLLGVPLEGIETPQHLQITGQLNLQKDIGRDTYADYKLYAEYGKSLEHSIGVDAIKFIDDQQVRKVTEWKLWEYSTLTSWGANERTPMIEMKDHDPLKAIEWMTLQLKKGDYTDDRFLEIDKALNILLKSLIEPDKPTQDNQPIKIAELADISTTFINSLKT
jgi:HK97 family phage prohead protease